MRSGEVQRSKQGNGKTVHLAIDMWAKPRKNSDWIDIHISVPGNTLTTVTNKPDSPRFHLALFQKLRSILISQNCWPFADIGAEKSEQKAPSDQPVSRFNPISIRGEPLSATIIRDRGER